MAFNLFPKLFTSHFKSLKNEESTANFNNDHIINHQPYF